MPFVNAGRFGGRHLPNFHVDPGLAMARAQGAFAAAQGAIAAAGAAISAVSGTITAANPVVFASPAALTVHNSGKVLVQAYITLSGQGATANASDVFQLQLKRGATILSANAEISFDNFGDGSGNVANGAVAMIDVSGAAPGTMLIYSIVATNLTGARTARVLAGQAQLIIQELAA
jgi:hypothetical protein